MRCSRESGPVMIICCEWLDDLPCPVVHRDADGWREVIVDAGAGERNGPRLTDDFLDWADRWWPRRTTRRDRPDPGPGLVRAGLGDHARAAAAG